MQKLCIVSVYLALLSQISFASDPPTATPDYSKEAYVIQYLNSRFIYENDGTARAEIQAAIKVLSDAGVQKWGVLSFSYQKFNQTLEIEYVRVKKADGSVVVSPADNVQDLTSEITRLAPLYTDQREKHVAVKGLAPGDVLEYSVRTQVTKPLIPGQFWLQYQFEHDEIIQQETLEVSIPAGRAIKLKNRGPKYDLVTQGDRQVYKWSSSNPKRKKDDQEDQGAAWKQARGRADLPDVLLSSFTSWDELGRWYDALQQERVKPSTEIKKKAAQLVKDVPDDEAKLRAIYDYVSTNFRYIGIDLGMGRYQPHLASDVMDNGYGDCKDKHTLLASLLTAAGFKAYPALINAQAEVDPDVPSPGQFDHVITVVEEKNRRIWLDTTPEVAPFGFLLGQLRGKHALVIPPDSQAVLALTPGNPESKSSQTFEMKASLDENGTLTGDAERTLANSDLEILLRAGFRGTPMPQWKDLVQRISYGSGFGGDVSEVSASSPQELDKPFRISYKYTRKSYSDWPNRRISPPLPVMYLPEIAEDKKPTTPVWLGVPGEVTFRSSVVLPKGFSLEVPKDVHIKEEFADYDAKYALNGNIFTTERHLVFPVSEVPVAGYEKYNAFRKVVNDDRDLLVSLTSTSSAPASAGATTPSPAQNGMNEVARMMWSLPNSTDSVAEQYDQDARAALMRRDMQGAISSLRSAVDKDPRFTRGWLLLAGLLSATLQQDAAIDAYRSASKAAPDQVICYKLLGWTLLSFRKFEDAIPVWQTVMKLAPDDKDGPTNLGMAFMQLKRYSDAAPVFAEAAKAAPNSASLQVSLAEAYLGMGDTEKGRSAFQQALKLDSSPVMLNNIAYALAVKNLDLDSARDYAEKAVRSEEELAAKLDIATIKPPDVGYAQILATFWDTLGWVYFKLNNLDSAEKYLNAAWQVSQSPVIGQHLGTVYEKQGKKAAAIHTYQLAVSAAPLRMSLSGQPPASTNETSDGPSGDLKRFGVKPEPGKAVTELNEMRTVKLPRIVSGTASAEFYVLLGPGKKVEMKFDSGKESLKSAEKLLTTANFKFAFPDNGPERIARKALLGCYPYSGCSLVLMMPSTNTGVPALVP